MGDDARWCQIEDGVRYLAANGISGVPAARDVLRLARKWGARPVDVDRMLAAAVAGGEYPRPADLSLVRFLGPERDLTACRICGRAGPHEQLEAHEARCSRSGATRTVDAVASVSAAGWDWSGTWRAARAVEGDAPAGVAAAAGAVAEAVERLVLILGAADELRELRARVAELEVEVERVAR